MAEDLKELYEELESRKRAVALTQSRINDFIEKKRNKNISLNKIFVGKVVNALNALNPEDLDAVVTFFVGEHTGDSCSDESPWEGGEGGCERCTLIHMLKFAEEKFYGEYAVSDTVGFDRYTGDWALAGFADE